MPCNLSPARWRDDIERIGGIAELSTLIARLRAEQRNVFLFDAVTYSPARCRG